MVLQEGGLAWAAGGGVHFPQRRPSSRRVSVLSWLLDCSSESLGDESPSGRGLSAPSLSFPTNRDGPYSY